MSLQSNVDDRIKMVRLLEPAGLSGLAEVLIARGVTAPETVKDAYARATEAADGVRIRNWLCDSSESAFQAAEEALLAGLPESGQPVLRHPVTRAVINGGDLVKSLLGWP